MYNPKTEQPRIYVASLSDYNAGNLLGEWIDADQDAEDILIEIQEMLAESSEDVAEDWAIHDTDGFYDYDVEEYTDLEIISAVAEGIVKHGKAYAYYANWKAEVSNDAPSTENFQECYRGFWENEEDFALKSDVAEERYGYEELSQFWKNHVDWDSVASEIFQDEFDAVKADYGIHVFENLD